MNVKIEESWRKRLQEEFDKPYFRQLTDFVRSEYAHEHVLPHGSQIFHMFNVCPFEKVKVVILGQDRINPWTILWSLFFCTGRDGYSSIANEYL